MFRKIDLGKTKKGYKENIRLLYIIRIIYNIKYGKSL
jgi:hypothetical protein